MPRPGGRRFTGSRIFLARRRGGRADQSAYGHPGRVQRSWCPRARLVVWPATRSQTRCRDVRRRCGRPRCRRASRPAGERESGRCPGLPGSGRERSTWVNRSKMRRDLFRRDADAVVADAEDGLDRRARATSRSISPLSSVYLAALLSRLARTWASRTMSALTQSGSGGRLTDQLVLARRRSAGGWSRRRGRRPRRRRSALGEAGSSRR